RRRGAAVQDLRPGDDVRPAVEARLAAAGAVAAVAEDVELGDLPPGRQVDGIVTGPRVDRAAGRDGDRVAARAGRAGQAQVPQVGDRLGRHRHRPAGVVLPAVDVGR